MRNGNGDCRGKTRREKSTANVVAVVWWWVRGGWGKGGSYSWRGGGEGEDGKKKEVKKRERAG
jgi:hypothetical protein